MEVLKDQPINQTNASLVPEIIGLTGTDRWCLRGWCEGVPDGDVWHKGCITAANRRQYQEVVPYDPNRLQIPPECEP